MINKNKIKSYIRNNQASMAKKMIDGMYVMVKDPLPKNIDINEVIDILTSKLPSHILELVDVIYVGEFEFLTKKKVNATFLENAIYVTNQQTNLKDLFDDVLHEYAHAIEQTYGVELYSDGSIENEFLNKRNKLQVLLNYEGYSSSQYNFSNPNFDHSLDKFLHSEIGYEKLSNMDKGLFIGPYSITSLSEYFATSFEEYYLNRRQLVRQVTPAVYTKLDLLDANNMENSNEERNYNWQRK